MKPSCVLAARGLMDLIKVAPQGGHACMQLILSYEKQDLQAKEEP